MIDIVSNAQMPPSTFVALVAGSVRCAAVAVELEQEVQT